MQQGKQSEAVQKAEKLLPDLTLVCQADLSEMTNAGAPDARSRPPMADKVPGKAHADKQFDPKAVQGNIESQIGSGGPGIVFDPEDCHVEAQFDLVPDSRQQPAGGRPGSERENGTDDFPRGIR